MEEESFEERSSWRRPFDLSRRERKVCCARLTDQELGNLSNAPDPVKLEPVNRIEDLAWPENEEDVFKMFMTMPAHLIERLIERFDELTLVRSKFFIEEGVAAILEADDRAREGLSPAKPRGPTAHGILSPRPRSSSPRSTMAASHASSAKASRSTSESTSKWPFQTRMSKAPTSSVRSRKD